MPTIAYYIKSPADCRPIAKMLEFKPQWNAHVNQAYGTVVVQHPVGLLVDTLPEITAFMEKLTPAVMLVWADMTQMHYLEVYGDALLERMRRWFLDHLDEVKEMTEAGAKTYEVTDSIMQTVGAYN